MRRFSTFAEFYPYYLAEHAHPACRRLHVVGTAVVLACVGLAVVFADARLLLAAPLAGYGFAWVGHFAFEHNRPATFRHPLYSLLADWRMAADVVRGRLPW